ncbi:hypothetical protein [Planctomyces sp. SH-PL62]|uniref:hypothetical protein n=1 Tax=Planctomyces sp. SH-PL62 TaxID=1636152 RepID=UPI00078CE344|nr:hypothetical protein [Planctomyces sp. SH-PL62]AMV37616.1 hypothetical protein VT85_09275 [Planctomyces sp. SH-PL62]
MNPSLPENGWEDRLRAGLGEAPRPDFEAWRARHSDALDSLSPPNPSRSRFHQPWRIAMTLGPKLIAATLLIALGALYLRSGGELDRRAFADTIPGVDDPEILTWTTTFYPRATSADGRTTWFEPERRLHAYRRPGQYRETLLDPEGRPRVVEITDVRAGRMLVLDLDKKTAVLKAPVTWPDVRGPFAWVGEALRDRMVARILPVKSVSLVGRKEIDGAQANLIRLLVDRGDDQGYGRRDLYFDAASKRLLAVWTSNGDVELESARASLRPPGEKAASVMGEGSLNHEIVVDAKLDAADFSLDPPAGFAFQAIARPTVTEEEMVGFLGAAARFNGDVFPDSPFAAFDQTKFNTASLKPAADRTAAEAELIRLHDKFLSREVFRSPVLQFVEDHAEPGSFQYVGAGAKLGEADRLVCWYTARGATKPRAVFGDLSIRDVSPADLPIDPAK